MSFHRRRSRPRCGDPVWAVRRPDGAVHVDPRRGGTVGLGLDGGLSPLSMSLEVGWLRGQPRDAVLDAAAQAPAQQAETREVGQ